MISSFCNKKDYIDGRREIMLDLELEILCLLGMGIWIEKKEC